MVLDKIKELGYTPNSLARTLGKGLPIRNVFLSLGSNAFWQKMIQGALMEASAAAEAVRDAQREGEVVVVGIDAGDRVPGLLDSRVMEAIEQSPNTQGCKADALCSSGELRP